MQEAAGAKNSKALQGLVHTCQAGCTSLLDRLHTYNLSLKDQHEGNSITLSSACQALEARLLNSLLYLQQHFPVFFNKEQPMPVVYLLQEQQKVEQQLQSLISQWADSSIDPELQSI